ncbi:MAG: BrnT family toxin [Elusimicrobiota bacterium]
MGLRYNFEWDANKAKLNIKKHKISFERAAEVFLDPFAVSIFDDEHSSQEERWLTAGKNKSEVVVVLVHTFNQQDAHQCNIRIISARRATKKEIKQYAERR